MLRKWEWKYNTYKLKKEDADKKKSNKGTDRNMINWNRDDWNKQRDAYS